MKTINPDDRITAEAIKALAEWALKQLPPLSIIAACDRALWWSEKREKTSEKLNSALTLLEQGKAILSNELIIKIQGDFVGQLMFGSWAEKVDALLANSRKKEVINEQKEK